MAWISIIKYLYVLHNFFFFLDARAKIRGRKCFGSLGELKTPQFPSEISWPFKDKMNIIDVLAIVPFFLSLFVIEYSGDGSPGDRGGFDQIKKVVQIFRIMRILRIFKLARHSKGTGYILGQ